MNHVCSSFFLKEIYNHCLLLGWCNEPLDLDNGCSKRSCRLWCKFSSQFIFLDPWILLLIRWFHKLLFEWPMSLSIIMVYATLFQVFHIHWIFFEALMYILGGTMHSCAVVHVVVVVVMSWLFNLALYLFSIIMEYASLFQVFYFHWIFWSSHVLGGTMHPCRVVHVVSVVVPSWLLNLAFW